MGKKDAVKIFIADDHPLLRMGLRLAFNAEDNIEVVGEAENGYDAIEKIQQNVPDVALFDIDMPGLSGTAAIRVIRKKYPAMKILVLSTYNDKKYIKESMSAGADGYIQKTIDIDELVQLIIAFHEGQEVFSPYLLNLGTELEPKQNQPEESAASLTKREIQILKCLGDGKNNRDISDQLYLSVETVKTHMKSIFRKLEVRNRLEAVMKAKNIHVIE